MSEDIMTPERAEALIAAADMVGRTGARSFEVGFEHPRSWWAMALYRGTRIMTENHPGPVEAAEALAVRLLTGARCRCGKLVTLRINLAIVGGPGSRLLDGTSWGPAEAIRAGTCLWQREGPKWVSGCGAGRG